MVVLLTLSISSMTRMDVKSLLALWLHSPYVNIMSFTLTASVTFMTFLLRDSSARTGLLKLCDFLIVLSDVTKISQIGNIYRALRKPVPFNQGIKVLPEASHHCVIPV
jgi:hypothetical protein